MAQEKTEGVEYIDMMPTWEEVMGCLARTYPAMSPKGQADMGDEMRRCGRVADRMITLQKRIGELSETKSYTGLEIKAMLTAVLA